MAMYSFSSGQLWGVRTDIATQTPVRFGGIQDISLDISGTTKTLIGQLQFPLAAARAEVKVSGKAKYAEITGNMFNSLFFGQTLSTTTVGQTALDEGPTAIPTTPFQLTVANSGAFTQDLGVVNSTTGATMTRVASGPITGQYSVSSGVYTFASADNVSGYSVKISYQYTATSGKKLVVANQLMGVQPIFKMVLNETFNGNAMTFTLNQCISSKLSMPLKNNDFTMIELDFEAFADSTGNVMEIDTTL